jgi:hypothetical protein
LRNGTFTDEIIRDLLATSLSTATVDANGWRNITNEGGSNEVKDFFPDNHCLSIRKHY